MGGNRIIALDPGRFNSVVCSMDAATRTHPFTPLATTPEAVHALPAASSDQAAQAVVVPEA